MLAQEVAAQYPGQVNFVTENFGASKLAERFGIERYPAVFIDDVLVARPRDFGFFAKGENKGRYTPWRNAENQAKFKADLIRMIDLVLAGKKDELAREHTGSASTPDQIAALPAFHVNDLAGNVLDEKQLAGKIVLVEFWATWCPPCRSTLEWLASLKKEYGPSLEVVALAVESPEDKVRATAQDVGAGPRWAISDDETARAFGDVVAVPTMLVFDQSGKLAKALYGAPPNLHAEAEKVLDRLRGAKTSPAPTSP